MNKFDQPKITRATLRRQFEEQNTLQKELINAEKKQKSAEHNNMTSLAEMDKKLDSIMKLIAQNNSEMKDLRASVDSMKREITKVNNSISIMQQQIIDCQTDSDLLKERLEKIEEQNTTLSTQIEEKSANMNALNQLNMSTQIAIHNIPPTLDSETAISSLSQWSKINLKENLKHANLVKMKQKMSCILYVDLSNMMIKQQLLDSVRAYQWSKAGQFTPILCEDIFNISHNDSHRGTQVDFRQIFTDDNKKIFNEARKNKSIFKSVSLGARGYIMVRKANDTKPIDVRSMKHLISLIQESNT